MKSKGLSNQDIWKILQQVIYDQQGIELKYITYDATIADDLGIS